MRWGREIKEEEDVALQRGEERRQEWGGGGQTKISNADGDGG